MSANIPLCAWCGRDLAVAPARVQNGAAEYLVHPGDCQSKTEAYVEEDVALHREEASDVEVPSAAATVPTNEAAAVSTPFFHTRSRFPLPVRFPSYTTTQ